MMNKLFAGRMTSRKRFAGKSDFSAKQVSTTLLLLLLSMLAPNGVNAEEITIDFLYPAMAAYQLDNGEQPNNYYTYNMSDEDYSEISGAKVGQTISYKRDGKYSGSLDISRLAFAVNTSGKGNAHNDGAGFYLRGRKYGPDNKYWRYRGLYAGASSNTELAILDLKPSDKVTITFERDEQFDQNVQNKVYCVTQGQWLTSGTAITVTKGGDMKIGVIQGVVISKIVIETADVAKYTISTSFNENTRKTISTFTFTENGVLDDNDFTLPNISASFGSINDYLVVQGNKEAHMFKTDGTETLENNGADGQPSAGSFYSFKPTADGTITVYGTLSGDKIHIFEYYNGWQNCPGWPRFYKETFTSNSFSFNVEGGHTYYLCINNIVNDYDGDERSYAYHLHRFTFETDFYVKDLGVVIDNVDNYSSEGKPIELTEVNPAGKYTLTVKRCTGNISPSSLTATISGGKLYMSKPTFTAGTDHAGTVIWDLKADGGDAAIVVTFPYHADFDNGSDPNRTSGHIWNFIDPRLSDSNIENCQDGNGNSVGELSGILSIGQNKDTSSQFHGEVEKREWAYAQRQTGEAGGFHDPMYKNVFDMVGDNADMIWETEGLIFETSPNLSCLWNESDAYDQSLTNPLNFATLGTDPDRYVGLMPKVQDTDFSSFTIPGLLDGDRVLIFMKSGESSGANGINLKVEGAKDALGKVINANDVYSAGGTNWQHDRYEGCYHFIKDGDGDMKFTMLSGSMCKLLYIHIYQGERISTTSIVSTAYKRDETGAYILDDKGKQIQEDAGRLLFMNDKGASYGQNSNMSLRFRGKGQQQKTRVLTCSGNLNYSTSELKKNETTDSHFTVGGTYGQSVGFESQVGEIGMFRLREMDMEYSENYVADFSDRNFTVGYRDKVDSYPYTWDFTDIQSFSSEKMNDEADNYPIDAASQDEYGYEWDISLFDADGNMKVNTGWDPITNNLIFSPHKIGFGNQLWAGGNVIPETRGLWFYSEDDSETEYTSEYSSSLYNDCLQITDKGIRFANVPDAEGKRVAWWNYKMVVPDVPADGAVYLRMKRDTSVPDDAKTFSTIDNAYVPFVATRFKFASQSAKTEVFTTTEVKGNGDYAFYKVPNTTNEWILAVKNTTGNVEHLTFTLNGWIVKKVAVSTDAKTVNRLGWATESRARVIDPALTSEMTGYPFKTYIVTDASYANKTVTLTEVDVDSYVMPIATEDEDGNGDNNAYIIRNTLLDEERKEGDISAPGRVQILNNRFHLFVPDMHDYLAENVDKTDDENNSLNKKSVIDMNSKKNMLVSLLTSQTLNKQGSGNTYNYALTSQKNKVGDDTQTYLEEIGFYRIKNGTQSSGNQGYLPVDCKVPTGTTDGGGAKMSIVFDSFDDPAETVETAIEVPFEKVFGGSEAVYYNLNGQKLSGKPTQGGLYIVNGKKVLVK